MVRYYSETLFVDGRDIKFDQIALCDSFQDIEVALKEECGKFMFNEREVQEAFNTMEDYWSERGFKFVTSLPKWFLTAASLPLGGPVAAIAVHGLTHGMEKVFGDPENTKRYKARKDFAKSTHGRLIDNALTSQSNGKRVFSGRINTLPYILKYPNS